MPPKKPLSLPPPTIPIGNCQVSVEARNYSYESNQNALQISISKYNKINISVSEDANKQDVDDAHCRSSEGKGDYCFVVVNPKDDDAESKSMLQDVLNIYKKELPAMNYAANTGKKSTFLQKCVSNGKFCTLLVKSSSEEGFGEVISAVTYQIIPADSLYAEIPLAAVRLINQHKGVGRLMYIELKRRLQSVGVRTIYCWGDEESEGFWLKQGFVPVGEVNTKGRARRLPVRADVRRSLCFPGGSTLMISHIMIDSANSTEPLIHSSPPKLLTWSSPLAICQVQELRGITKVQDPPNNLISVTSGSVHLEPKILISDTGCSDIVPLEDLNCADIATALELNQTEADADGKHCSCSAPGSGVKKRRVWDASHTSLNSKKVKGGHLNSCELDSRDCLMDGSSLATSGNKSLANVANKSPLSHTCSEGKDDNEINNFALQNQSKEESLSRQKCYKIMLMNIADNAKQSHLTKIIEELGGDVTADGSLGTHVITGKVRRTLKFCTALCSGACVISACWLKESYRQGRFVDERPFLLKDDEYELKYRIELETAVLRAMENPQALFRGYDICVADHVQPPASTILKIATCAGGKVIHGIDKVNDASKTIYIASEVEMKEALSAVNKGIWTFSSEWFMNCVMKQELDFDAPQFAESL
ncbi:microcephalin [Heracleum sosnowskyi]|uniref:Microcephalin n=1 Tax=Heracleum sosnowskyi TaxID=360622 RepID=A0AAD8HGA1_9APIA|nr:microcephalin [Heracleum sosnowskyi]